MQADRHADGGDESQHPGDRVPSICYAATEFHHYPMFAALLTATMWGFHLLEGQARNETCSGYFKRHPDSASISVTAHER
jgi:hypothetical protein